MAQQRIAVVTGGMGGLGESISTKMADAGYKVVVTYSPSNTKYKSWLDEMKSRGYAFGAYPVDVADFEDCAAKAARIAAEVGPIDILVNNAGITRDMTFKKMTKADWDAVMRTNLDSCFNMTKQVMDGMVERAWGRVINVSSVNGQKGAFGQTNYSAAKAGIHGFTKALALEVAKKSVTINTISPGYIGTQMVTAIPKEILDSKILPQIPVGRLGKPDEVAGLITRPIGDPGRRRKQSANPMRDAAEKSGIPVHEPADINSAEAVELVRSLRPDLLVVCDYGQILSRDCLATAPLGGINLHGSLLPRYRGAAPVAWAIWRGETVTGVSVIHMTGQLDGGPVLTSVSLAIGPDETCAELEPRLARLGVAQVIDAIETLERWERWALIALIAFSAATHTATLAVLLVLIAAGLVVALVRRGTVPFAGLAHGGFAIVISVALLFAANYAVAGRLAWTPGGSAIPFGRMLQAGIVARYLAEHCPDPRLPKLCANREKLPDNADHFFWGSDLFDELGRFEGLGEEMRIVVRESLSRYPASQIKAALAAAAEQLVRVATGYGVHTDIWHTTWTFERFAPQALPAMKAARQQNGELDFAAINRLHLPVAWGSMLLLVGVLALAARRRRYDHLTEFATVVALAILANAAVCGALSNPNDRYGARMVWLATLVLLLIPWMRRHASPPGDGRSG